MSRTFNGLLCMVILLSPAVVSAQVREPATPAPPDAALNAAVKALVSTVSALSQEIRSQRDDIDRLNREVAEMKKAQRASAGEPKSNPAAEPKPTVSKTLEEQLEALRAERLQLIELTAATELSLIDELTANRTNPEAGDEEQKSRIALLNRDLERRRIELKTATDKITLLQRYVAARNELDALGQKPSDTSSNTSNPPAERQNPSVATP